VALADTLDALSPRKKLPEPFESARDYIRQAFVNDRMKYEHILALVYHFQDSARYEALAVDGKPGPKTLAQLEKEYPGLFPPKDPAPFLHHPLPAINGRMATITSGFRTKDRPTHDGVDLFYKWRPGDRPDFVGDGGCEGRNQDGSPKWVVPYGTQALAAADGTVQIAGNTSTGYRCWIDHGNGLRSGYFHLETLDVRSGDPVKQWQPFGLVGHNPAKTDGRHLHFEVSPVDKYAPVDPQKYLVKW
jgi:murein DD-endopeptidase MepM/ murein hydrolase activator NlpD